jgi:hypothetical protein
LLDAQRISFSPLKTTCSKSIYCVVPPAIDVFSANGYPPIKILYDCVVTVLLTTTMLLIFFEAFVGAT